jgi:hypothetical protein
MSLEINQYHDKFWRNGEGKLHRVDGPAVEWHSGPHIWVINGQRIVSFSAFIYAANLTEQETMLVKLKYPTFNCSNQTK